MTLIGIISVRKINNLFSYIINKKYTFCQKFGEEICFLPIEISYYKNIKALHKKVEKAEAMLIQEGAFGIVMTKELLRLLGSDINDGIPSVSLLECFNYIYKMAYYTQYNSICLVDKDLSLFDYKTMAEIICFAKDITIYTDNIDRGRALSNKLFDEYGVWIKISNYAERKKAINTHMLIDVDKGKIRLGDIVADGIEYNIDLGRYDVDLRCLASIIGKDNSLKVKNLRIGKNLIKLVDN